MKQVHCLILAAALATQGAALAQGRQGGKPAADAAAEHQHHDHGAPAAAPAKWQGKEWTKYPVIQPVMGGSRERGISAVVLKNSQATSLDLFSPDLSGPEAKRQVPVGPEGAMLQMAGKTGNYYWVTARDEAEGRVSVASTAAYFSNPGPAPTNLLLTQKNEFEIIPQPLPREHSNYRESEKWSFLVRFNGQPVPDKTLKMETEFGTKTAFVSDAKGMATVLFPRDFKPADPGQSGHAGGHRGPRRAKFVLTAEHESEGRQYLTAFNYTYAADPDRTRNLAAGVGFGLFGMLLATPLLRRRQGENNEGGRGDV